MQSRTHRLVLAALTAFCVAVVSAAAAQEGTTNPQAAPSPPMADTYPLDVCPISGQKLGKMGPVVVHTYEGREVRFCCSSCAARFDADPKVGFKKLDERIVAAQQPAYPLDVCPVSDRKLGEMGKSVDYIHDNQLVRFCCASCIGKFAKAPEEYIAKLQVAYAAKKSDKGATDAASQGGHEGHGTHMSH